MKESKAKWGVRALARSLHRSPSHICRVLQGERKPSAQLAAKMRKLGLTFEPATLREALKRQGVKFEEVR